MAKPKQTRRRPATNTTTGRKSRNTYVTKSGQTIKLNRNLSEKVRGLKDTWQQHKAIRLAGMPKTHLKRLLYRLKPANLYKYWFSREGAIMALKVLGVGIVVLFILTVGAFAYLRKDIPAINNIYGQNLGGSIDYYDSTGKVLLWQDYNAVKRVPEPSSQISPYMKDATVAIEDKNFYHEGAISFSGIIRAGLHDVTGGGSGLQGASTITEQLVKLNAGYNGSRTIGTKIKEVILAEEVEREYSKNDILTGYLNIAPYGGVDYGIQAAAEDYFREPASQLTLAQSAMLASIPQSPSYYSPYSSPQYNSSASENLFGQQALLTRQQYVLDLMAKQGYITQSQANAAKKVNVLAEVQPEQDKYANIQDPYFVLAAKQSLENILGTSVVSRGGLKVITTINLGLQSYANEDVQKNEAEVASVGGDEEAMVAENVHNGQVVAMIGGENFTNKTDGQLNFATLKIEPGSSLKPFMYADLIQNNTDAGAGSVLYDSQTSLPGYPCTNKTVPTATSNGGNCLWDDNYEYPGPETIRYALAGSRNVPAVEASYEVDPTDNGSDLYAKSVSDWIDKANQAMGTTNAYACYEPGTNVETDSTAQMTQCYGSAVLGSGDVSIANIANGDTTFANEGEQMPQSYILNVTDTSGQTLYKWTQPKPTEVYKPDTAYIINDMLDDPRATYLQPFQKFENYDGWDIAVKTGTENQSYNGVMTAWNTQYAVVGFAGYHTLDKQLELGQFENATEPITKTWIEQALNALDTKPLNWTAPPGIKTLPSFQVTESSGYGQEVPSPSTDVYPSWYVTPNSSKSVTIDKVSGSLATSCTPTLARETIGGEYSSSGSIASSIDIFYPIKYADMSELQTGNSSSAISSTQTDDVHQCGDQLPTISLQSAAISCNGSSCSAAVNVAQGTHPLSSSAFPMQVNAIVDGQTIRASCSFSPAVTTADPPNAAAGECTFNYGGGGTHSVQFQVIDSVLYASTTSAVSIDIPSVTAAGGPSNAVSITWTSGDQGTGNTYTAKLNNGQSCTSGGLSCTITGNVTPGSYTVQVTDSADQDTSPPLSFTVSGP